MAEVLDSPDTDQDEGHELPRRRCRVLHLIDGAIVMVAAGAAGRYATATRPGGWCMPALSITLQARRGEADDDLALRALEAITNTSEPTP